MTQAKKKVSIIETTLVPLQALRETFYRILPEIELISFVDESLLAETAAAGEVTRTIRMIKVK